MVKRFEVGEPMYDNTFRVGISRGLMRNDGTWDLSELGLDGLAAAPGIDVVLLGDGPVVMHPDQLTGLDALVVETNEVRATSLEGADRLFLVARYGVGYDSVDVSACTRAGIIVSNAPDGTQRPMATVNLAMMLALSLRIVEKDRMTRDGRWQDGSLRLGRGLMGRSLGLVGMGSIGSETLRLAAPLGMRHLVHDPYVSADAVRACGAEPVALDDLLCNADIVCLAVPLTPATRHLIGPRQLSLMRPEAYLINATRGAVVDEAALIVALRERWIAGAALDVFEQEPVDPGNPLLAMEQVIVTPHSLGSTDECFRLVGESVTRSVLDVATGRAPRYVVDRRVLDDPRTRARLAAEALHRGVVTGDRPATEP